MLRVQARASDEIAPEQHVHLGPGGILNVDVATMREVKAQTVRILACDEAIRFRAIEVEGLILEAASLGLLTRGTSAAKAAVATDRLFETIQDRQRIYYVAFALPGLRMRPSAIAGTSLTIGACEFCPDYASIKTAYARISMPVQTLSFRPHVHSRRGIIIGPAGETIAVVQVRTSPRYANQEALAQLEAAYGFFVLWYDLISGPTAPYSAHTRQPLVSWQSRPRMVSHVRVAATSDRHGPMHRTGGGVEESWSRDYDVDLDQELVKLQQLRFDTLQAELFQTYADVDMAARIRTALRWLARALLALEPEAKFLNLAIALETIFTARSSDFKIGRLIRDCVLRVGEWEDADRVGKLVSGLYGRRSGIVHQGNISQFTGESETMHAIVTGCLIALFNDGHHTRTYDEMLTRLGIVIEDYRNDTAPPALSWRQWIRDGLMLLSRRTRSS